LCGARGLPHPSRENIPNIPVVRAISFTPPGCTKAGSFGVGFLQEGRDGEIAKTECMVIVGMYPVYPESSS
jgi:hypothetical protein